MSAAPSIKDHHHHHHLYFPYILLQAQPRMWKLSIYIHKSVKHSCRIIDNNIIQNRTNIISRIHHNIKKSHNKNITTWSLLSFFFHTCLKMKPFYPLLSQTLKDIFKFIIFLDRIKGILTQKFLQGIFKMFLVRW
jgi:hypothetical protein